MRIVKGTDISNGIPKDDVHQQQLNGNTVESI